ncbi:unnamed protein product [marine sediment metagenome]|uniref:Uncharacterized protein n=1 Tax=marine sediment metagenome TaxID=412755 RepID=X1I4N3_9ZZZZ
MRNENKIILFTEANKPLELKGLNLPIAKLKTKNLFVSAINNNVKGLFELPITFEERINIKC